MSENTDIISVINELLGDPEYWDQVLEPPSKAEQPPPASAPLPPPQPPKVGTIIQRSDWMNQWKQVMLTTVPPLPPKRSQG
ncbi:obscurin-like protein 1 isoform x2 protein [Lasius niger]|uniref:Obscurin-like protein 1 isoform x2 protein n=1 Tax=Lasius niger TaxID=67767 RepID=A0A0J7KS30_LASNI|nr:obscurin-like protein 1 isoform x2 protein [Lasius niger]